MNNPAPTNNNAETATCATSSPLLKRETPVVVRPVCFIAVLKSKLVARHAGTNPNSTPVNSETATVNTSTRQFKLNSTPLGKSPVSLSVSATSAFLPQ